MGKRELLIILAFVAAGIGVYEVAAPPPAEGRGGFSLSDFAASIRRGARGNQSTGSVTTRGTISISEKVTEVRLSGLTRVSVRGEARRDIAFEMTVESNGPDEATAQANAAKASLTQDLVGPVLALRPSAVPGAGRQVSVLSLTVPGWIAIRVTGGQGGGRFEAADVSAVQLDGVVGDVRLTRVAGAITGNHRNGELTVSESGALNATLVSTKAELDRVSGTLTLNARNGRIRILNPAGPVELDVTNQEIVIIHPAATVRVTGNGGKVAVENPLNAVNLDIRRAPIDIRLERAVALTVLASDAPLHVWLDGPPPIALDVAVVDGKIDASDFSLTANTIDQESQLHHTFGAGTAPAALRNQRAEIVIGRMK